VNYVVSETVVDRLVTELTLGQLELLHAFSVKPSTVCVSSCVLYKLGFNI